jgi:hypothetical protein
MLDLLNCGKGKLDDPIIMTWALQRYQDARARSAVLCRSMEEEWFDDLTLRRWIDTEDQEILPELFRVLPVERFSNVNSAVFERWKTWSGPLARQATPVLLGNPADAVLLFAEHIQGELQDYHKTSAVIAALASLPEPAGLELLRGITARVSELEDEVFVKQILVEALLWPTAALDPGGLAALTKTFLRAWEDREDGVRRLLEAVCSASFGGTALFDNAVSLSAGESAQTFRSLRRLFLGGAPLEECDRILIESDPCPDALDLLEKHRTTSAATTVAFSVIDTIRSMEVAADSEIACFAVAAILSAFERAEIVVDDLSMEDVFDVLTLDLSENRHFGTLTERLRSFDFRDIALSVNERMPSIKNSWGGIHLANLVGELRLVDSIPILIDSLNRESGDFLCEAAQEALVRIGEPAQLVLIARWGELDSSQGIYGRGVLEQVGGRHTAEFAVEHFQKLFRDDVEGWCGLAEAAPDERSIDLLEPELRRKQPLIDETFYCLCMLTGRGHENLGDIRKRVMEKRRRDLERLSDFTSGKFPAVHDTVTLALKCERCGDVNRYEVRDIVVGGSGSTTPFFIGDEFPCASCGEWPDFELTTEAVMGLTATMMMLSAEEAAGNERKGPLRLVDAHYRWEQRPAPEVMAELKAAVAENPNSIDDHLRLGRVQYLFNRRRRAAECYSRVLELEPDSMEAGLGLAHVMADTGSRQDAYDRLCTMLERQAKWRFFRVDELPPAALGHEFAKLYNQLQTGLGFHERPLLHTSFLGNKRKVGRNDPCPCGSGKKYKKCCLQ